MMIDAERAGTDAGGGAMELAGLVAYQRESVVSRTLVKNGGGSVTVFAFDEGQSISEHTVPHEALVLVIDGEGRFTVGGTEHIVAAGEVLHMPSGVAHAVAAPSRFKMVLTMLKARPE